ncbi:MAG: acyltransferase family protein [Aggregatilineales bacterium]
MKAPVYFYGLSSLRFLAAFFVIIHHIEQFKGLFGLTDGSTDQHFFLSRLVMSGTDAVILFFVLSGFLITYLLLVEIEATQTISIRDFYIRRSLRIWPLYYVLVVIGFLLVPLVIKLTGFEGYYPSISNGFARKLFFYVAFLPNIAGLFSIFPVGIAHLWTIGIEEYFYLLWPQLVKRTRRNILSAIVGVLIARFIIGVIIYIRFTLQGVSPLAPSGLDFVILALGRFPFEGMALGALMAYILYHQYQRILHVLYHPVTVGLTILFMTLNMLTPITVDLAGYNPIFARFFIPLVYAIFILNIATSPRLPMKLENNTMRYAGKLSYGMYMYHPVLIYFTLIGFDMAGWNQDGFMYNVVLYSLVTVLTLLISHLSYQYIEMPFLTLKKRFTIVQSGQPPTEVIDNV